jgi:hypothetical protein
LTGGDKSAPSAFGTSVALSADGNTALIGGPTDNTNVGAAWLFTRSDGGWTQRGAKLTPNDETGAGQFGAALTLSADGDTALIGGPGDTNGFGGMWIFGPQVVGTPQIQPFVDSNPAGTAEAFRYTAAATAAVGQLSVYLDGANAASEVTIGLYTNTDAGNPGTLLTSGTITDPAAGAWNSVATPPAPRTAGSYYWLAVLAPHKTGLIEFRDLPSAGGPTQTSAQTSLSGLPSVWRTGTHYANSPASLFAAP